ncbi:response regulator (plasmid) [Streptoverticillium reticulum]|uniref:response regulator transcription factor n=1 Tax=Streptoverticillium reticulum TaxID=1433415 RepID=UPI0039BFE48E
MIRTVIVDDEVLVRGGLRALLATAGDIEVVGEAADGVEAISVVREAAPDVVLMDVHMTLRDGIEATRQLVKMQDAPAILVLTSLDTDNNVLKALDAGAMGFILKTARPEQILTAVRMVAAGGTATTPDVMARLVGGPRVRNPHRVASARQRIELLNERHREVLLLVSRGYSNARIAKELVMTESTIKTYVSRMLDRLGLENRTQAALLVYESGMLDEPTDPEIPS